MSKIANVRLDQVKFQEVQKDSKLYCVKFADVLRIQTQVVTCLESITNSKGDLSPYLFIQPDKELETFLEDFDRFVQDNAYESRDSWFTTRPSRRELEDSFKRYLKDNIFRLKLGDDLEVFDANRQPMKPDELRGGEKVKLVMEVSRVSIGKSSYGTIWKCLQVMRQRSRECMIADDGDVANDDDDYEEFA